MDYNTTPQTKQTIQALWRLEKIILQSLDFNTVVQEIVDSVLLELGYLKLGYGIVVLALVDEKDQKLKRISISRTPEAEKALAVLPASFKDIVMPISAKNLSARAVTENKVFITDDWSEMLCPPYAPEEAVIVQGSANIKSSMIFPVVSKNKPVGIIIFSMTKNADKVSADEMDLIRGFTDVVGLAVQNSTLYSKLEKTSKDLQNANMRLKQLDRLKDEFVSLASHELRTPMTIIKSYLWMFLSKNKGELDEKDKRYVERAYESTDRLINLVNDMLNVSRIESGRLRMEIKNIQIDEVTQKVVTELTPRANQLGLKLSLAKPSNKIPLVRADAERVEQILINLIGNSMKFTPSGGSIIVKMFIQKDGILTQITDTGKGMNAMELQKLFQKFSTMGGNYLHKQEAQSTGLGLYLSKSLVELHGGKIWAESPGSGKGSSFSFTIPYASQVEESSDGLSPK